MAKLTEDHSGTPLKWKCCRISAGQWQMMWKAARDFGNTFLSLGKDLDIVLQVGGTSAYPEVHIHIKAIKTLSRKSLTDPDAPPMQQSYVKRSHLFNARVWCSADAQKAFIDFRLHETDVITILELSPILNAITDKYVVGYQSGDLRLASITKEYLSFQPVSAGHKG